MKHKLHGTGQQQGQLHAMLVHVSRAGVVCVKWGWAGVYQPQLLDET